MLAAEMGDVGTSCDELCLSANLSQTTLHPKKLHPETQENHSNQWLLELFWLVGQGHPSGKYTKVNWDD